MVTLILHPTYTKGYLIYHKHNRRSAICLRQKSHLAVLQPASIGPVLAEKYVHSNNALIAVSNFSIYGTITASQS
jgi:hypothetical protein